MSDLVIEGTFSKVPDESWRTRLVAAKETLAKRTVPAFIEFCQEVHAFRLDCDSTQGGSEFSRKGCEWLGCSTRQLHYWDAVGRRAPELCSATSKLPFSEHAISQLASLDDIAFRKALPKVQPDMTQKQVRELVKEVSPPRQREIDPEERDTATSRRLYKAFTAMSEKHQRIFAQSILDHCMDKGWKML